MSPVMQGDAWLAFFMADWVATRGTTLAVESHHFTAIWRRAEDLETIGREWPALLCPYAGAVIAEALGSHAEPVRDLKNAFHAAGIGDAGWKLLLQADPEDMRMPLVYAQNDDAFEVYAWSIKACLIAGRLLPGPMLARLIKPHGHEPGIAERVSVGVLEEDFWPPFLRALGRRLEGVDARTGMRRFLDTEFEDVFDWLESTLPDIDANQARAGWPWMLRQHRLWTEQQEALALARREQMHWRVPVREAVLGEHRVVALADAYELWEEGCAMRHCARNWAARCLEGRDLLISIRDSEGRRLATGHVGLVRGTWMAGAVRLPLNRIATRPLPEVAAAFAALLNARGG